MSMRRELYGEQEGRRHVFTVELLLNMDGGHAHVAFAPTGAMGPVLWEIVRVASCTFFVAHPGAERERVQASAYT